MESFLYGQLTKEACDGLAQGAVCKFPHYDFFIRTPGGFLSPEEIFRILWQRVGDKPFRLFYETVDPEPVINSMATQAVSDSIAEGRKEAQ